LYREWLRAPSSAVTTLITWASQKTGGPTIETPIFDRTKPTDERLRLAPNTGALTRILLPMREFQVALRITF